MRPEDDGLRVAMALGDSLFANGDQSKSILRQLTTPYALAAAALPPMVDAVQHQAFFMACQGLYQWLGAAASIAPAVVRAQRSLT